MQKITIAGLIGLAAMAGHAAGAVTFSNVVIGGSLSGGSSFQTGATDIDFSFPAALVGDPVAPLRNGTLEISFIVEATAGEILDRDILSLLGSAEGRGLIEFSETVEDLVSPGQIASFNMTISSGNPPPRDAIIVFSRASSKFKVTKSVTLSAIESTSLSLASVALIEQNFVPTPGAAGVMVFGGLAALRRRR